LVTEKTYGHQKSLTFDRTQKCESRAFLMSSILDVKEKNP